MRTFEEKADVSIDVKIHENTRVCFGSSWLTGSLHFSFVSLAMVHARLHNCQTVLGRRPLLFLGSPTSRALRPLPDPWITTGFALHLNSGRLHG